MPTARGIVGGGLSFFGRTADYLTPGSGTNRVTSLGRNIADVNTNIYGEPTHQQTTTSQPALQLLQMGEIGTAQTPGNDGSTLGSTTYNQQQANQNAILRQGLNTQIANLEGQLGTLNPQEQAANARVLNQYQTNRNRLDTGYSTGQANLSDSRNQVNEFKERSLKNLRDSIMMQSQGYNNQLGAFGAGDSSAAGMINFALGQQGSRERGNLLEEAGAQLTGIKRQEEELQRSYDNSLYDLDNWKQTTLADIGTQYQQARAQIQNSILDARARAAAEQNLTQEAISALQQLENNYRTQGQELASRFQNALAPQNVGIDPSLQQYAVQPLSPTQLEALRMPAAVNPESGVTALLRRRDEEQLQNPLGV